MPNKINNRTGHDRGRVSNQKHEIDYTGGKVAEETGATPQEAKDAVKQAKKEAGVSRGAVEEKAKRKASEATRRSGDHG